MESQEGDDVTEMIRERPIGSPLTRDRPRERLAAHGASALTDSALLAVVLSCGGAGMSAEELGRSMVHAGEGLRALDSLSMGELMHIRGIGTAKAARIKAAFELGRRLVRERAPMPEHISDAQAAVAYVSANLGPYLRDARKECFCVLLLNRRNRPISTVHLTTGTVSASLVDPGEVVREALLASASGLILVHNHPSGDEDPSPEDISVTGRVGEVCRAAGVELLDHIIIGRNPDNCYSFCAAGLLEGRGR